MNWQEFNPNDPKTFPQQQEFVWVRYNNKDVAIKQFYGKEFHFIDRFGNHCSLVGQIDAWCKIRTENEVLSIVKMLYIS